MHGHFCIQRYSTTIPFSTTLLRPTPEHSCAWLGNWLHMICLLFLPLTIPETPTPARPTSSENTLLNSCLASRTISRPLTTASYRHVLTPYTHTCIQTHMHSTYFPKYLPTYLPTYLPSYLPACLPASLDRYMHRYMHTYMHACMHACINTYIHTYIHTYHIYTHTHIHIYTYTHIYTFTCTYLHTYIFTYLL